MATPEEIARARAKLAGEEWNPVNPDDFSNSLNAIPPPPPAPTPAQPAESSRGSVASLPPATEPVGYSEGPIMSEAPQAMSAPREEPPAVQAPAPEPPQQTPPPTPPKGIEAPTEPAPSVTVTVNPTTAKPRAPRPAAPQQPAQVAKPAQPAGPAPEPLAFDPTKSSRGLKQDVAATQNKTLDALDARGDVREQLVDARNQIGAERQEGTAASLERQAAIADKTAQSTEDYRKRQEAEIEEMKAKMGKPPFDTVGLVFGIISAVAAANGKDKVAAAMQGLGQVVNYKMKAYQGGLAGNEQAAEGYGKLHAQAGQAGRSEVEMAHEMNKQYVAEMVAAAEMAEANATTEDQRQAAKIAKEAALKSYAEGELKVRGAREAAAYRNQVQKYIAAGATQEDRKRRAEEHGDVGLQVYSELLKGDKGIADYYSTVAGAQKTQAETGRIQAQTAAGPEKKAISAAIPPGWTTDRDFGAVQEKRLMEYHKAADPFLNSLVELRDLQRKYAGKSLKRFNLTDPQVQEDFRRMEAIRNRQVGMETQITGAGSPTGGEYVRYIGGISDVTDWTSADAANLTQRTIDAVMREKSNLYREMNLRQQTPEEIQAERGGRGGGGGQEKYVKLIRSDGKEVYKTASEAARLREEAPEDYQLSE